ncbi:MAG: LPS export ABC transporter periplasmic protein LptC [Nitrospirae bacterium]|nr:LPS export ABC transporter periplasmic protein LptC [Nitrospirota bacterium]MCL5238675.1 LPS export ABC transporter periplasmic protein LptC [Nitrospirota bacterium]
MKKILFLLAFVCFFTVLAIYSNREGDIKTKVQLGGNSYMDDVSITQKKNGIVKWLLKSRKAVFLNDNDVKLTALQITFPEKELTLTSESGMYDIEKRNLKIENNIKASTKDYDIVASTLFWDASKNELLSDEKVRIIGKKFFVEGDNLTATTDNAKLNNNVKAIFYGK